MNFQFRSARPDDLNAMNEILHRAFIEEEEFTSQRAVTAAVREIDRGNWLVAVNGPDQPVAVVCCRTYRGSPYLVLLAVEPKASAYGHWVRSPVARRGDSEAGWQKTGLCNSRISARQVTGVVHRQGLLRDQDERFLSALKRPQTYKLLASPSPSERVCKGTFHMDREKTPSSGYPAA